MTKRKQNLIFLGLLMLVVATGLMISFQAWAQVTSPTTTATTIDPSGVVNAVLDVVKTLILGGVMYLLNGFLGNKLDEASRQMILTAVTAGLGKAQEALGKVITHDIIASPEAKEPYVQLALAYANQSVPAAISRLNLTPADVEGMIKARIPFQLSNLNLPPGQVAKPEDAATPKQPVGG